MKFLGAFYKTDKDHFGHLEYDKTASDHVDQSTVTKISDSHDTMEIEPDSSIDYLSLIMQDYHVGLDDLSNNEDVGSSTLSAVTTLSSPPPQDMHSTDYHCNACNVASAKAKELRLERRRHQNRMSQQKFRARKEAKITEALHRIAALECLVKCLEEDNQRLNLELAQQNTATDGGISHIDPNLFCP